MVERAIVVDNQNALSHCFRCGHDAGNRMRPSVERQERSTNLPNAPHEIFLSRRVHEHFTSLRTGNVLKELEFLILLLTVGAVCDRAFFPESKKNARSQTAPTVRSNHRRVRL